MRRYAYVAALVTLVGCAPAGNTEEAQNAVLARDREWSETTKDIDKFLSFVSSDATIYPAGLPAAHGLDQARKTYIQVFSTPGFAISWKADKAVVSGDLAYTTGTYQATMTGGSEKGKYVTVWKKEGDTWKVVEDIFNADGAPPAPASKHVMMAPAELKWSDPPPSLPPGAKMAVVMGDPSQAEPFVIRAQVPAGYKVPPHWHPGVENLTVLSGTVALGMGEQFDEKSMTSIGVGGYASLPAEMRHYFIAKSAATFQVHGMGPFVVNYVNPADDPSKK
jgi:ketosteroid isomerase-like protein